MSKKDLAVQPEVNSEVMELDEEELAMMSGGKGFEEIGNEDLVIPRLQLIQYASPQLKKNDAKYVPDLEAGWFYNTVTGEIYGEEILFVAVKFTKSRTLFGTGGTIDCSSSNGIDGGNQSERCVDDQGQPLCPHAQFGSGKNGKGTKCTNFKNALGYTLPTRDLVSFSLKGGAIATFREWNSKAQSRKMPVIRNGKKTLLGDLPLYSTVYKLTVVERPHPDGAYFVPVVSPHCWTKQIEDGKELMKQCDVQLEALSQKNIELTDGDFS